MNLFKSIANIFSSEDAEAPVKDLGRNELCWCGSGKKYKKCHLVEDEKKANRNYAANCGKA